jgi:hypothetical protein
MQEAQPDAETMMNIMDLAEYVSRLNNTQWISKKGSVFTPTPIPISIVYKKFLEERTE